MTNYGLKVQTIKDLCMRYSEDKLFRREFPKRHPGFFNSRGDHEAVFDYSIL